MVGFFVLNMYSLMTKVELTKQFIYPMFGLCFCAFFTVSNHIVQSGVDDSNQKGASNGFERSVTTWTDGGMYMSYNNAQSDFASKSGH